VTHYYDVTIIDVRPGTHPKAAAALEKGLSGARGLLGCWYSEIGVLNRILVLRHVHDVAANLAWRAAVLNSGNPFGVGEFMTGLSMDTYVAFDFLPTVQAGEFGPYYEVRSYVLKPDGLGPTQTLWREWVPRRVAISPLLAAMTSVSGAVARFMHVWPYKTLDERARLRAQAIAENAWPPRGGPDHLLAQQTDIYLPFSFSPLR